MGTPIEGRPPDRSCEAHDQEMGLVLDPRHRYLGCRSYHQPPEFQDFVIVHELLHLRLPNHGKLFKATMTVHVPDWKRYDIVRNDRLSHRLGKRPI